MKKIGLVFLVLMALVLVGSVGKANAASLLISPAEFTPDGSSDTLDYVIYFDLTLGGSTAYPCLVAPVRIPSNATRINKVIVYLEDDGVATEPAYFGLDASDMTTGTYHEYGWANITTGTGTVQPFELYLAQRTLAKGRIYQLTTCLDSGQYLYGVKVVYTVP